MSHSTGTSADQDSVELIAKVRDKLTARFALNPLGDPALDALHLVVAPDEKTKLNDALVQARARAVLPAVEGWARHGDNAEFRGRATRLLGDLRGAASPPMFNIAEMLSPDYRPGTKEKAEQEYAAFQRASHALMLELARDPTPEVAIPAAEWLLAKTNYSDLPAMRLQLAFLDPVLARGATSGDAHACEALLILRGGPQAATFLADLAAGKKVPLQEADIELATTVRREPTPAAQKPLELLLAQKFKKRSWHGTPTVDGGLFAGLNMEVDRVQLLVSALCAVDYEAAKRAISTAPEDIRPALEKMLAEGPGKCREEPLSGSGAAPTKPTP